jgi:hypothetical protein
MGAPKGNQFWRLRSSHGRDKLFETPELLWEAAGEYFNWCDSHPWYKVQPNRSSQPAYYKEDEDPKEPEKLIKIPQVIPYTLSGLCLYLDASERYWSNFRTETAKKLKDNPKDELSHDFMQVIDRVETIIKTQKLTGAAVGAFNANIVSRELGMADKIEARQVDKEGNDVSPAPPALNIIVQTAVAPIAESEDE